MLHTRSTEPSIVAIPADGRGSIAGFRVTCPCGFTFTSSLRTIAEADAREHVGYMLRSDARLLRFAGESLFSVATRLGVTKEWLRERAGLR